MKNLLKSILSVAVLCLMTAPAFAFPDVSNDYWAAPQIKLLSQQGVIVGYPDGTFKPNGEITRAEMAAVLDRYISQNTYALVMD